MPNDTVKRCKLCGKILISDSMLGLCPMCTDKVKRGATKAVGGVAIAATALKGAWKPLKGFIKK